LPPAAAGAAADRSAAEVWDAGAVAAGAVDESAGSVATRGVAGSSGHGGSLRTALGAPKLIQTVVKRGYRLALDPAADAKYADV